MQSYNKRTLVSMAYRAPITMPTRFRAEAVLVRVISVRGVPLTRSS